MKKTSKSLLIVLVASFFAIQLNAQVFFDTTAGGTTVRGNKNLGVNTNEPEAQIHLFQSCPGNYNNPFRISKAQFSGSVFCDENKFIYQYGNQLPIFNNPSQSGTMFRGVVNTLDEINMFTSEPNQSCNIMFHWDIDVRGVDNSLVFRNIIEDKTSIPSIITSRKDIFSISNDLAAFNVDANIPNLTTNSISTNTLNLNGPLNGDITVKGNLRVQDANGTNVFAVYQNGNIRARKTIVDLLPIPDYVFKKDYKLMNLKELELYIQQNNHLPNIKSEAEYTQAGEIDLGELNLKLLEKVEELTLYTINQQKQIDELKKMILELKK